MQAPLFPDLRFRERLIETLEGVARLEEDPSYARAAAIIRRGSPKLGRRSIDDEAALAFAQHLLAAGLASSKHDACLKAAPYCVSMHSREAAVRRLERKWKSGSTNN